MPVSNNCHCNHNSTKLNMRLPDAPAGLRKEVRHRFLQVRELHSGQDGNTVDEDGTEQPDHRDRQAEREGSAARVGAVRSGAGSATSTPPGALCLSELAEAPEGPEEVEDSSVAADWAEAEAPAVHFFTASSILLRGSRLHHT